MASNPMSIHLILNDKDRDVQRASSEDPSAREDSPESDCRSYFTSSPELRSQRRPSISRRLAGSRSPPSPSTPSESGLKRSLSASSSCWDSASRVEKPRRQFRPPYTVEEKDFIWYHRDDLGLDWTELRARFERRFPGRNTQGLQCKYYRHLTDENVPMPRNRDRHAPPGAYGILKYGRRRYSWMKPEHRMMAPPR